MDETSDIILSPQQIQEKELARLRAQDLDLAAKEENRLALIERRIKDSVLGKYNSPGKIDPKLLIDEGAKDIDLAQYAKMKALGNLGTGAGRIASGALKNAAGFTPIGMALNVALTPSLTEEQPIPGRSSFAELHPDETKINRMPTKEMNKYEQLKDMFKGWKVNGR